MALTDAQTRRTAAQAVIDATITPQVDAMVDVFETYAAQAADKGEMALLWTHRGDTLQAVIDGFVAALGAVSPEGYTFTAEDGVSAAVHAPGNKVWISWAGA